MFANIITIIAGGAQATADRIDQLYFRLVLLVAGLFLIICVQWGLNVFGLYALNLVAFFLIGGVLGLILINPVRGLGTGAILGTVYAFLNDKDLTQGAYTGIVVWLKAVVAAVFSWWVITGFLATWSFQNNPWAFWPVAAMACVILATTILFAGEKTKKIFPKVVIGYALVITGIALWSTTPWGSSKATAPVANAEVPHKSTQTVIHQKMPDPIQSRVRAPVGEYGPSVATPGGWCPAWDAIQGVTVRVMSGGKPKLQDATVVNGSRMSRESFAFKSTPELGELEIGYTLYPPAYKTGNTVVCPEVDPKATQETKS